MEKIKRILNEVTKRDNEININTSLKSLGIDSLEKVELQIMIEEEYNITLDDGNFDFAETVGDLLNEIKKVG